MAAATDFREFDVELDKAEDERVGVNISVHAGMLVVKTIIADGLVFVYNQGQPDDAIRIGDCIVEINGEGRDAVKEMLEQLRGSGKLLLRMARPSTSKLDEIMEALEDPAPAPATAGLPTPAPRPAYAPPRSDLPPIPPPSLAHLQRKFLDGEFALACARAPGVPIGLQLEAAEAMLRVLSVLPGGFMAKWNESNPPETSVKAGDSILEVDGLGRGDPQRLLHLLEGSGEMRITLHRPEIRPPEDFGEHEPTYRPVAPSLYVGVAQECLCTDRIGATSFVCSCAFTGGVLVCATANGFAMGNNAWPSEMTMVLLVLAALGAVLALADMPGKEIPLAGPLRRSWCKGALFAVLSFVLWLFTLEHTDEHHLLAYFSHLLCLGYACCGATVLFLAMQKSFWLDRARASLNEGCGPDAEGFVDHLWGKYALSAPTEGLSSDEFRSLIYHAGGTLFARTDLQRIFKALGVSSRIDKAQLQKWIAGSTLYM